MLKLPVKAGAIANLTDARFFAAWEVNWLGFSLDPNQQNFVTPKQFAEMRNWVQGPTIVGEFGPESPEAILEHAAMLELDTVQVGLFQDVEHVKELKGLQVIKEIIVDASTDLQILRFQLEEFAPHVDCFVLDFSRNHIPWAFMASSALMPLPELKALLANHKVLLDVDADAHNLPEILDQLQPYGLQLKGGAEEKVGYKSFDELDPLLDLLEQID